jgi:methyl-accepting chemotaxis protein
MIATAVPHGTLGPMAFAPRVLIAAVAVAVFATAGCGGGNGNGNGTNASPTVTWADSLCSALASYTGTLKGVGANLKGGGLSRPALESAATQVHTATEQLVTQVENLGKPDTSAGTQAKQAVGSLTDDLRTDSATVQEATNGASGAKDVLSGVSVVTGTLVTAADQVTATVDQLQALDPKGELKQAFAQAGSCASLTGA